MDAAQQQSLHSAIEEISSRLEEVDEVFSMQIRLATAMLRNAADAATSALSPRTVSDMEFALNDLLSVADELPVSDRAAIDPALRTISDVVRSAKGAAALPPPLVERITLLHSKLRERKSAIEREPFRPPGSAPEALPHEPATLQPEAETLRLQLREAGFDTPALDRLIEKGSAFRLSDVRELMEELEVIIG
jgi:hypothetical protein